MSENLSIADAIDLIETALIAHNVSPSNAKSVALALVQAEIDGQGGHGFSRVASYCAQAASGKVNGHAKPIVVKAFSGVRIVDAKGGFAFPAIDCAIEQLAKIAPETGIAMAGINNSHHCGQLGAHVERLADLGFIAIMVANSPKAMAPWGGADPLFGTNPIAFAAPRIKAPSLVIDLSLSKVARGKVMAAQKAGKDIPLGWALNKDGKPTTNPVDALAGTMLPMGDAKGAALALIIEVLSSALIGANFSYEASSFFDAEGPSPGVGHTIIAFDPRISGQRGFLERIEMLIGAILAQDGTRLPGSSKHALRTKAQNDGLIVPEHLLAEVRKLGQS